MRKKNSSISNGQAIEGEVIPSLKQQRMMKQAVWAEKSANQITGKKRVILLLLPLLIVLFSFVLSLFGASFLDQPNLSRTYFYIFSVFIAISATGVMYAIPYLISLLLNHYWIGNTLIGFNRGLWLVPINTGLFSFIPNIYPIALAHQRTISNYLMIAGVGFLITLVWIICLKLYLKYKKKHF